MSKTINTTTIPNTSSGSSPHSPSQASPSFHFHNFDPKASEEKRRRNREMIAMNTHNGMAFKPSKYMSVITTTRQSNSSCNNNHYTCSATTTSVDSPVVDSPVLSFQCSSTTNSGGSSSPRLCKSPPQQPVILQNTNNCLPITTNDQHSRVLNYQSTTNHKKQPAGGSSSKSSCKSKVHQQPRVSVDSIQWSAIKQSIESRSRNVSNCDSYSSNLSKSSCHIDKSSLICEFSNLVPTTYQFCPSLAKTQNDLHSTQRFDSVNYASKTQMATEIPNLNSSHFSVADRNDVVPVLSNTTSSTTTVPSFHIPNHHHHYHSTLNHSTTTTTNSERLPSIHHLLQSLPSCSTPYSLRIVEEQQPSCVIEFVKQQ